MSEKTLNNIRVINKHDTEANWLKATGFTPKQGELIVYDIDSTYSYERIKIGDGVQNVNALPFVDDDLKAELVEQIGVVDDKVDKVIALVGDEKVSDQIEAAQIIHVGPNMPTDPNIKVWINTAEEGTGVVPVLPRITTITLAAASWTGGSNPWSQVVEITADANIGISSKLDPQPTAQQIVSMQNEETSIMLSNEGGNVVAYAIGNKPTVDYTMQVLITEVAFV